MTEHLKYLQNSVKASESFFGHGVAYGTFGELIQGILPNKKDFMVTLPVKLYSNVKFIPDFNTSCLEVFPSHKIKSKSLVKIILNYFGLNIGGQLIIDSEIIEGKGLASSSADLVATTKAMSKVLRFNITPELTCKFLQLIEPSDGVMYKGITSFYHKELKLIESLGYLKNVLIIGVEDGGTLDTIEYNLKKRYYLEDVFKYQDMLFTISNAIKNQDLKTIGKISSESAILNQKNNYKKLLKPLLEICEQIQGIGVVVAHSGTYSGIMLDKTSDNYSFQKSVCVARLKNIVSQVNFFHPI